MNPSTSPLVLKQPKSITLNSHNQVLPITQYKIKPIFRNKAKWRCLMHSDITYINKYKPKMLSSIELKGLNCQEINGFRNLSRALADTKRISSLIITDPDYYYENFTKFGHLLKITNRWKKLTLDFMNNQDEEEVSLDKEKVKSIIRLRRCKDLSSLSLSFDCYYQTKRKILKSLSRQVQGLPHLKTLNIDISACYPHDDENEDDDDDDNNNHDDTNSPILTFRYPRSLQFLQLNFQEADSIDTALIPKFASNIQRCCQLDNVAFNFRRLYYHMENSEAQIWTSLAEKGSGLKTFTLNKTLNDHEFEINRDYLNSFQYLKTLENLNVDFYFSLSEQNNQTLPAIFFAHLASLTNLKSLNLALYCRSEHPSLLNIQSLQSLSKLEHLCLNLINYLRIEDQFLQELASMLPFLYRLKHFELILPNSGITDQGILTLSSSFSQLSQLRNLSVNFKNTSIDHKTIEILSNNIANLNLTSLKVILGNQLQKQKSFLQKLSAALWESEKRLTSLFSALYGLNSLENLSLSLSGFDICTKEFKHFSLALQELKQLKTLSLELPQFDSGNNFEGLRRFLSSLKELQKLNFLHLTFKGGKLCNKEVELIALNLRDFSQSIEDLELRFEHAKMLENEVLNSLGLGLQSLLSLKKLSIFFGRQKFFSLEAVFELSKKLAVLKSLESLILDIKLKVYYNEVKEIHVYMRNHQNLKNLTIFIVNGNVWIS